MTWASAPARDVRFALVRHDARHFLIAEMLLLDAEAAAADGATNQRRALPFRVVRRLR